MPWAKNSSSNRSIHNKIHSFQRYNLFNQVKRTKINIPFHEWKSIHEYFEIEQNTIVMCYFLWFCLVLFYLLSIHMNIYVVVLFYANTMINLFIFLNIFLPGIYNVKPSRIKWIYMKLCVQFIGQPKQTFNRWIKKKQFHQQNTHSPVCDGSFCGVDSSVQQRFFFILGEEFSFFRLFINKAKPKRYSILF